MEKRELRALIQERNAYRRTLHLIATFQVKQGYKNAAQDMRQLAQGILTSEAAQPFDVIEEESREEQR